MFTLWLIDLFKLGKLYIADIADVYMIINDRLGFVAVDKVKGGQTPMTMLGDVSPVRL